MKRVSRGIAYGVVAALVVAAGLTLRAQAPQQRPGGGGPQGAPGDGNPMRMMFNPRDMVERAVFGSWAFVALELDTNNEQLVKLRGVYQKQWADTKKQLDEMSGQQGGEQGDRQARMQAVMGGVRTLRDGVKEVLTADQNAKLDAWFEQQGRRQTGGPGGGNQQRPQGGGNRGGGAGGGRPNQGN